MLIASPPPFTSFHLTVTGTRSREDHARVRNIPGQHCQRDGRCIEGVEVRFVSADGGAVGGRELDSAVGDSDLYLSGIS